MTGYLAKIHWYHRILADFLSFHYYVIKAIVRYNYYVEIQHIC